MEFTVQQIADMLGGTVEGDPSRKISALAKIEEAGEKEPEKKKEVEDDGF